MSDATRTCQTPVSQPIKSISVAYQNAADSNYVYWSTIVATGGQKKFGSNAERMQYLLGQQGAGGCGVPLTTRTTTTN